MAKKFISMDGNQAAAYVAYDFTEVAAIYPITPSSPMAEHVDEDATKGRLNLFGTKVKVAELQAEGGAAGAVHGALQAGALATTFTASQGLLLMIPNLYKWAGELLPAVIHVAARSLAVRSLSIFGDHQDIYACRQTGVAMIASDSVQEAMDLGGVAHLTAIKASAPVMHFFDGFRTSHEIQKIEVMDDEFLKSQLDMEAVEAFRARALDPHGNAVTRGGAENDDIYFQGREAQNEHYAAIPDIANGYMEAVSQHTGRQYKPFVYYGAPDAQRIIIAMGSVNQCIEETVDALTAAGEKVGMIKVHLYRPFSAKYLKAVLPASVKKIAVLDRTKEMGTREPLYLDVLSVLKDENLTIVGGRYGLSSRDTQPNQIKAVFDELGKDAPAEEFTIGINDDVTHLSLTADPAFAVKGDYTSCLFWGLGSDGTVSANKSSIKIIGDNTDQYAQAYFQYDSKKSGGVTRSHLRFGPTPIRSTYYITNADFVSCSLDQYVVKYDMLKALKDGGTFLLNTMLPADEIVNFMPNRMKVQLAKKHAKFYIINATAIAQKLGLGSHTNTILQSSFFALNEQIMPYEKAVELMKGAAKKSYGSKGDDLVQKNYDAIDSGKSGLVQVDVKAEWADLPSKFEHAKTGDAYFDEQVAVINDLEGYDMPVSAFTKHNLLDGSIRNNVSYQERRTIASFVPQWDAAKCIQCGLCSFVCPHATIRGFLLTDEEVEKAPMKVAFADAKPAGSTDPEAVGKLKYRVQVSPDNCVGCGVCASKCPVKALTMTPVKETLDEVPMADYMYRELPAKSEYFSTDTPKGMQFVRPYFEISGSCPGCGEAPYYRLVSQLFGKDMLVSNATGCSMIYCSSTPSTPFTNDADGNGVAWANSLFEDNAEFGYGMALAKSYQRANMLKVLEDEQANVSDGLKDAISSYLAVNGNREEERKVAPQLIEKIKASDNANLKTLLKNARDFVSASVWIVGGDGWAYDIGYGGLDHVMANNLNVNVLVLDTEVYSNTGGQSSKSSQRASIAQFAAGGKTVAKKDMASIMMSYGHIYVAGICLGSNPTQAIKALKEAENYNGPSIVMAYCPCIEHHIKGGMVNAQKVEQAAVACGYFNLFRFDPRKEKPLTIDQAAPDFTKFHDFLMNEARYSQLLKINPQHAEDLYQGAQDDAKKRYEKLVKRAAE